MMTDKQLNTLANIKASGSGKAKTFTAEITSDTIDSDSEVLIPDGMVTTRFDKNPVVFWNHDYTQPIGTSGKAERTAKGWAATATLAKRPDDHPEAAEWFPDTVHSLIKQNVIRGVSVGFEPIEGRNASKKDKATFGAQVKYVFSKWKLLEFSVAPLQANEDALITAVSKSLITPDRCRELFDLEIKDEPVRKKVYFFIEPAVTKRRKRPVKKASDTDMACYIIAKKNGRMTVD
jgi:HK97 family phage prohead protease